LVVRLAPGRAWCECGTSPRTASVSATLAAVSDQSRPALDLRRPFTRAQARAAGISDGALRGPRFQRLGHGIHLGHTVAVTARLRVEAVLLVHPDRAYASHASAGRVYGLPLPVLLGEHVTVLNQRDRRRAASVRHHLAAPGARARVVHGVRVSPPVPLFIDAAAAGPRGTAGTGREPHHQVARRPRAVPVRPVLSVRQGARRVRRPTAP
jgi:hypothetical protein